MEWFLFSLKTMVLCGHSAWSHSFISVAFPFPSCWKYYGYIELVPEKGDSFNPSNYLPIVLIPCLSKVFQSTFNWEILMYEVLIHLIATVGSSGGVYWRSSYPPNWLLVILSRLFLHSFAVTIDSLKAFESGTNLCFQTILQKQSHYIFISSFLCGQTTSAVVNDLCPSP